MLTAEKDSNYGVDKLMNLYIQNENLSLPNHICFAELNRFLQIVFIFQISFDH